MRARCNGGHGRKQSERNGTKRKGNLGEGVPIPPIKLYRDGRVVRDVKTTMLLNSRMPDEIDENVNAVHAVLAMGERRVLDMVGKYSIEAVQNAMAYAQSYAERQAQSEIANWPKGTFFGDGGIDDGTGDPATVRARVDITDDCVLIVDFEASDGQRASFCNSARAATESAAKAAVLAVFEGSVPANSGLSRVVRVLPGSRRLTSPEHPTPVGGGPYILRPSLRRPLRRRFGRRPVRG